MTAFCPIASAAMQSLDVTSIDDVALGAGHGAGLQISRQISLGATANPSSGSRFCRSGLNEGEPGGVEARRRSVRQRFAAQVPAT